MQQRVAYLGVCEHKGEPSGHGLQLGAHEAGVLGEAKVADGWRQVIVRRFWWRKLVKHLQVIRLLRLELEL